MQLIWAKCKLHKFMRMRNTDWPRTVVWGRILSSEISRVLAVMTETRGTSGIGAWHTTAWDCPWPPFTLKSDSDAMRSSSSLVALEAEGWSPEPLVAFSPIVDVEVSVFTSWTTWLVLLLLWFTLSLYNTIQ